MGSADATASVIRQVRQALLVTGAAGAYLDGVGNNRGVPRPENTSDDELYRRVIKALAWLPKSLLLSYYALLTAVFGSQEQVRARLGRSWKVYEVNANELIIELPAALLSGTLESSTYLHGATGFARVAAGPTNTFTTDFDLRLSSAVSVVGLAVHVETAPGTWADYTVTGYSFSAGTATVQVSASTLPTGGGRFYLEVPGDGAASYRGDYMAAGLVTSLYSTAAAVTLTNTLSVVGDVTGTVLPGMTVQVGIGGALQNRVVSSLSYSPVASFPATAAATAAAAGGGTWSAGWLGEDPSAQLGAAFGGTNLPEVSGGGSPVYRVPGPLGDFAVRVTVPNTGWTAASTAFLDIGTGDLCGIAVVRVTSAPATADYVCSKTDFAGGHGFTVQVGADGHVAFEMIGTLHLFASTPVGAVVPGDWTVVMWALDRGTNRGRVATQSLGSGVQKVSPESDTTGMGSMAIASPFRVAGAGALDSPLEIAAVYMGVGAGAAAGLSANLAARLASFCASLGAPNVTRVVLTTTDVPGGQAKQPFILPEEVADTATTPPHNDRIYLTGTGLYQVVQFYLDLLVRTAGIAVRLVIL